jgi:hypothetical protein
MKGVVVMKMFLLTAVTAAVLANLTDAALAKHRHRQHPYASVTVYGPGYASPYDVYSAGTYVGSDPDPRARAQMLMDYNRGVYGLSNR